MSLVPGANRRGLEIRAELLAKAREFFARRNVLEVDTPALSEAAATEPALLSLTTAVGSLGARHFLHTSPEFAMKRLLAAGSGDIYQVCRVFRDGELGRWHQPEFTMLEWYRLGFGMRDLMNEVRALLLDLLGPYRSLAPVTVLSYSDAFIDRLGIDPHGDCAGLGEQLSARGIDVTATPDRDALLDLALATVIAPSFPGAGLTLVYDYPASQAALARVRGNDPPVAERFEAFVGSLEIANGFHELNDASEQRRRFEEDNAKRIKRGLSPVVIDEAFLLALESLPDCAGVAVGLDRLVAVAAGADDLASTLSFVHRRSSVT